MINVELDSSLCIEHAPPNAAEFNQLRKAIGWDEIDTEMVEKSLAHSLFHVTIRKEQQLLAMGRIVGDGQMYFYIQDVVVNPIMQRQGLGNKVMAEIEGYLTQHAKKGATIGLLAAKGKEAFYQRYGYLMRPNEALGNGMCKFI